MLIIEDWSETYSNVINQYWKFADDFSKDDGKNVLFLGLATVSERNGIRYKEKYKHYQNKMRMNWEHPCSFQSPKIEDMLLSADSHHYFDKVFTQCPYTAEWLNNMQQRECFKALYPTPYNKNDIVYEKKEKIYDVLYWGGIHGQVHKDILNVVKDFNYNFLTFGVSYWGIKDLNYQKYITGINIPKRDMWSLTRETKINVMTNVLPMPSAAVENIKRIKNWEQNRAFSHLDYGIMPQIKGRPFESAINRCLMLVKRDPWNINEMWFEPDKEFLYYDNDDELREMITEISSNWSNYEHIVDNAFDKAINSYTTEHWIKEVEKECV